MHLKISKFFFGTTSKKLLNELSVRSLCLKFSEGELMDLFDSLYALRFRNFELAKFVKTKPLIFQMPSENFRFSNFHEFELDSEGRF